MRGSCKKFFLFSARGMLPLHQRKIAKRGITILASRRFATKPPGKAANRKTLQLCRQVERVLSMVLEGDLLRDLLVQSVVPAPDSSRLLATVIFNGPPSIPTSDVVAALESARVRLRAEVAAGIHRRKTPDLCFQVLRG